MKITIKRGEWYRGKAGSALVVLAPGTADHKQKCCLGFLGIAYGANPNGDREFDDEDSIGICGAGAPRSKQKFWPRWLFKLSTYCAGRGQGIVADDLIEVNDNVLSTDDEKEKEISRIFAENGDEAEFV